MAKKEQNILARAYRAIVDWKGFWIVGNLLLAVVILLLLVLGVQLFLSIGTKHGKYLTVPEFAGMTITDAQKVAEEIGIRVEVVDSVYAKKDRGKVREQNPPAGTHVKKDRKVRLTMNAFGVQKVAMPNLVGYSARQAVAELNQRGLSLGRFIYVDDMATNNVLQQKYKGDAVEPGEFVEAESRIDLVVGLNRSNSDTKIPDVKGKRAADAVRDINDAYLNVRAVRYDRSVKTSEDSLKAVVFKQAPEPSEELSVMMGTEVTVYLHVEKTEE